MSVRMRVNRSHTGNRRSHHALKEPRLSKCTQCSAEHLRHRMCPSCGYYRGRQVIDVVAKKEARMKRREANLKAAGEDVQDASEDQPQESKEQQQPKNEPKPKDLNVQKETTRKRNTPTEG